MESSIVFKIFPALPILYHTKTDDRHSRMAPFLFSGLIQRLPLLEPTFFACQVRNASITHTGTRNTLREPWKTDPTYRRISPPPSIQWKMPTIPQHVLCPSWALSGDRPAWRDMITCAYPVGPTEWYDEHLADGMRNAGRRTAQCLAFAKSLAKPGMTTRTIGKRVTEWAFSHGCYPSSLNYGGFPGSMCASINNVMAHGVPSE